VHVVQCIKHHENNENIDVSDSHCNINGCTLQITTVQILYFLVTKHLINGNSILPTKQTIRKMIKMRGVSVIQAITTAMSAQTKQRQKGGKCVDVHVDIVICARKSLRSTKVVPPANHAANRYTLRVLLRVWCKKCNVSSWSVKCDGFGSN